jgi:hypothetical protein
MAKDSHFFAPTGGRRKALVPAGIPLLLAMLAIFFGSRALAQTATPGTTDPSQPFFAPAPPAGFDPVRASDADLRTYGFPPRPPLISTAYAGWVKMVTAARAPVANPTLRRTNVIHGPARNLVRIVGVANTTYQSQQWSGIGVTGASGYFKANNSYVVGEFPGVPAIYTSVEDCKYGPYYATMWVGLDGYGSASGDVLQVGVNLVACGNGTPPYQAWFEWNTADCNNGQYACSEVTIGGFQVNQGDVLFVVVTYYTTSPNGNAYFVNYSTGQYTSVLFNEPSPTNYQYKGDTAEWIVERPLGANCAGPGGGVCDLTDYAPFYMEGTYNGILPGSGPESGPDYFVMFCPNWNPVSACQSNTVLSSVTQYVPTSGQIFFTPAGPATQYIP